MSTKFWGEEYFEALGENLGENHGVVVEEYYLGFRRICDHPMLRTVLLYLLLYTSIVVKIMSIYIYLFYSTNPPSPPMTTAVLTTATTSA